MKIDQNYLHKHFYYEPFQGIFYKRTRKSRTSTRAPYTKIKIDGHEYMFRTSTLIYMYVKGFYCPYVMRIDKNPANNRWLNFHVNDTTAKALTQSYIPYKKQVKTPPI